MRTRDNLHDYQVAMHEHIVANPFCALWALMGSGKSGGTLSAVDELIATGEVSRVLIVAPKRVASISWPDELAEWSFGRDLRYQVHVGNRQKTLERIQRHPDTEIDLINWDNLPWLVDTLGRKGWRWDMVVLDESSVFKRPSSVRFKALRKVRRIVKRLVELTGTPSSNGLLPLWTQAFLLDQGERLFKSHGAYKSAFFDVENPYSDHPKFIPKPGAKEAIGERLSDIVLTVDPTDYLDTHEPIYNRLRVELPPSLRNQYDRFEEEMFIELEKSGGDIEAPNVAVLKGKLAQFCNGAMYDADRRVHEIHTLKLDVLKELQETATAPFLVAFSYRHDWDRIKKVLGRDAVLFDDDPNIKKRWDRGEIPFLCAHPASIGHGLSLQHGSNQTLWFGSTYNLEYWQQFNERVGSVRQAQSGYDRPLVCHSIVVKNSVEDEIAAALGDKDATQSDLVKAVRKSRETRPGEARARSPRRR